MCLRELRRLLVGAGLASAATGCVADSTTPATTAPTVSGAFLGYSDAATQQTTCGNCHVGKQAEWLKTGHAKAWADLPASGRADTSCTKCHTTSAYSFGGTDTAGFFGASSAAKQHFEDVQCESCHGPGQAHAAAPDETPLLPFFVSYDSTKGVGCGTCHRGASQPFLEDWRSGGHGTLEAPAIAAGGACLQCHEGRTAATRFGEGNAYVEATDPSPQPIGCNTCHDAHGNRANPAELRRSLSARDTTNLCIQCHQRRSVPDLTSSRGPHSPQGPTLLGTSGWRPDGFVWDTTAIPSHADTTANPTLCARCHVATFDVNNAQGQLAYRYTGHKFYAIPCVTQAGVPDTTNTCDVSSRNFSTCADNDGCHASPSAAPAYFQSLDAELRYFTDALWVDVNGNGKVDAGDTGLLTQVPSTEFVTRNSTTANLPLTVAEGAAFNVSLFTVDGSHGVHNPPYLRALLIATIRAVQSQYGLAAPPALQVRLARPAQPIRISTSATRSYISHAPRAAQGGVR